MQILDIDGRNRELLPNDLNKSALINWLCSQWIQYWECKKCGRFDYCKYPAGNERAELRCSVAVNSLTNFINSTYEIYNEGDDELKQHYLDAAFYFCRFVHDNEIDIGKFANNAHVQHWAEWREDRATSLFSCVLKSRQNLDLLAENLRKIKAFPIIEGIVLVEGWSEYVFLHNLKESGMWHFDDLRIEVYGGKGNRKPRKLQLLLEQYIKTGFLVFLQADADGQTEDIFSHHKSQLGMKDSQLFAFKHELETAYPTDLAVEAACKLGWIAESQKSDLVENLGKSNTSKVQIYDSFFSSDWDKIDFAAMISKLLAVKAVKHWHDETFQKSELGKFLEFVQQAKWYSINSAN